MLKTSSNGIQATTAIKFSLRPTAETLADLSRPIDPRHLKTRKQGTTTLTYCPWNTIARHLHHRAPGWCWEVQSVQEVGGAVVVTGRLTIPTADGDLLHYSAVASEPLESASKAPAAEVAASSCLRWQRHWRVLAWSYGGRCTTIAPLVLPGHKWVTTTERT